MKRGLEMGQEGYKRYGQHLRGPKYVLFEATFHVVSYERARRREDNDRFLPLLSSSTDDRRVPVTSAYSIINDLQPVLIFMGSIRGHPYMTSAKFGDFFTPSPLVRIWD